MGTLPGSTLPSWLIAPELRLQPVFFPTCTGAAAVGSYRQRGGTSAFDGLSEGQGAKRQSWQVRTVGWAKRSQGIGREAAQKGFETFGGCEGSARMTQHIGT